MELTYFCDLFMEMINTVRKFVEEQALLPEGAKVLVAFSGGPDSVALLDILQNLHYSCTAVHVNFHLRGAESDRDENFARGFCQERNIPLQVEHLYAKDYAAEHGVSIEMAARSMRYDLFETIRSQHNLDAIAVGHHRDDSIETFFLNLLRGSSLRGLTGIRPKNGYIVRPLLCVDRADIIQYLQQKSLNYITDSSNLACDYKRNKIRLQLLPLLEDIQPSARKTIARSLHLLSESEQWYEAVIADAMERLGLSVNTNAESESKPLDIEEKSANVSEISLCPSDFKDISLKVSDLEQEKLPQSILYAWLSFYGFDARTVETIWENRHASSGKIYLSGHWRLLLDRSVWKLSLQALTTDEVYYIEADTKYLSLPVSLEITCTSSLDNIPKTPDTASLDFDRLQFPLTLRHPRKGDSFVPLGMTGRKLLSDYFIDQKKSLYDKERCWLLCSADDIVWIVGERMDHRYRITLATQKILRIKRTMLEV